MTQPSLTSLLHKVFRIIIVTNVTNVPPDKVLKPWMISGVYRIRVLTVLKEKLLSRVRNVFCTQYWVFRAICTEDRKISRNTESEPPTNLNTQYNSRLSVATSKYTDYLVFSDKYWYIVFIGSEKVNNS